MLHVELIDTTFSSNRQKQTSSEQTESKDKRNDDFHWPSKRNLQPKCLRWNGQNDYRAQSTTKVFEQNGQNDSQAQSTTTAFEAEWAT